MRSTASAAKHSLYIDAFHNVVKDIPDDPGPTLIKKLIFYGVKIVNTKPKPASIGWEEAISDFQFAEAIKVFMGTLTPGEFVNLFPVEKDFDGHRYGAKDYFYTRDYIRGLPANKPIGSGKEVSKFLWEYTNRELTNFSVIVLGFIDNLCRLQGQPTAWESFCEENGIKTYTMQTDQKGKQFMIDNETGERFRVKKRIPRYLKLIK